MRKIDNWENIQESTSFKRLPVGGYQVKILNVEDHPDREYLKIYFDITSGDEKGYFKKAYDADTRKDKKWPNAGLFIRSYKDSAASMFKGFTVAVEKSNKGYVWNFDEKSLVGKAVGLVVGEEEYQNQKGAIRVRNYVAAVRSIDVIKSGEFEVPELKKLDPSKLNTTSTTTQTTTAQASFVDPFANENTPSASEPAPEFNDNPFGDDNPCG